MGSTVSFRQVFRKSTLPTIEVKFRREPVSVRYVHTTNALLSKRNHGLLFPRDRWFPLRMGRVHLFHQVVQPRQSLHEDGIVGISQLRAVEGEHLLEAREGLLQLDGGEPISKRHVAPVEERYPGGPPALVVRVDMPVDADPAIIRTGQLPRDRPVLDLGEGERLRSSIGERDQEGVRRKEQGGRVHVATCVHILIAAACARVARNDGIGVVSRVGDAALGLLGLRSGHVAVDLPAGDSRGRGINSTGVRELGGVDPKGRAALVSRVEAAHDLPVLGRGERGSVHVWRKFEDLQLEDGS